MLEEPEARVPIPAAAMNDAGLRSKSPGPYESGGNISRSSGLGGTFKWRVLKEDRELRLDLVVSQHLLISPEEAALLIDFGSVHVQGRIERAPSRKLAGEEEISVNLPPYGVRKFYEVDPARIFFRDRFLLGYDKEAGTPSQQTPYDAYNNTFAGLQRYRERERNKSSYAALHHRLDRETSGVMLFALDRKANLGLSRIFQEGHVGKEYLAWVTGRPEKESWTVDLEIAKVGGGYRAVGSGAGKKAKTVFRVLHRGEGRSLLLATPLTGRTHQIRIHLAAGGHPVVGDRAYGAKPDRRLYLHALRLSLKHPILGTALTLEAPVPPDWSLPPGLKCRPE
jgi:23S rRNA pseudouridine1911/1915/1917 synthase